MTDQKPYVNLGAGKIILPGERPYHHALIPESVHAYPKWVNVDKEANDGIDCIENLFTYPWSLPSNAFDGALLSHICEHIPHPVTMRNGDKPEYEEGFFAFMAEFHRILRPGAVAHILFPYAMTYGAMVDPTHTRFLLPSTFGYVCGEDENAPFHYTTGGRFQFVKDPAFSVTQDFMHLTKQPDILYYEAGRHWNVMPDAYIQLRTIK